MVSKGIWVGAWVHSLFPSLFRSLSWVRCIICAHIFHKCVFSYLKHAKKEDNRWRSTMRVARGVLCERERTNKITTTQLRAHTHTRWKEAGDEENAQMCIRQSIWFASERSRGNKKGFELSQNYIFNAFTIRLKSGRGQVQSPALHHG